MSQELGGHLRRMAIAFMALFLLALAVAPAADARRAKPNLVVTAVSNPPKSLHEGKTFKVSDTVRNTGRRKAGRSVTRYYLTKAPKLSLRERRASKTTPRTALSDILLIGSRRVRALRPKQSSRTPRRRKPTVEVPGGTPSGTYFLLACADDEGTVRESRETDNCRASKRKRVVSGPPASSWRIDAFSDTREPPEPFLEQVVRDVLPVLACQPTKAKRMSLSNAITSSKRFLTRTAGADAMAKFRASPEYRSADLSEQAAGAAVLAEAPGAALAALVRAHELQPREASHLINAAGVAASVSLPNEALAFLDRALALGDRDRPAMGLSRQAIALTTRGYALLQIGRYGVAERTLEAALAIEPLLSEAAATLAGARACQGKDPVPMWRRGRKRQDREPPIDDSQGKVTELRNLPFPALPANAFAMADFYRDLEMAEGNRLQDQVQRENALNQAVFGGPDSLSQRRTSELLNLSYKVSDAPDLRELDRQFFAAVLASHQKREELFGSGDSGGRYEVFANQATNACQGAEDFEECFTREIRSRCIPAARNTHQAWLNDATKAYELAQEMQRIYSKRVSGIAANLENRQAYRLVLLGIETHDHGIYGLVLQSATYWANDLFIAQGGDGVAYCVDTPLPPPDATDPGETPVQGPGECPNGLRAISLTLDLKIATLKANCEQSSLEVGGSGWISAFGEVSLDHRGGSLTVVAGSKGEVGLGPLKGDFKSGVYVTADRNGFKDVGWRVGPSYTVSAGPAEFGGGDTMDMSFVGALGSVFE